MPTSITEHAAAVVLGNKLGPTNRWNKRYRDVWRTGGIGSVVYLNFFYL
jgi:hypothetical protein